MFGLAESVLDLTDRNKRVNEIPSPFLDRKIGTEKGGDILYHNFFRIYEIIINECYKHYNSILEISKNTNSL